MGLQVMYARLEADFPGDPQAWDLRARRCLSCCHASEGAAAVDTAEAVYREGLAATGGPLMYDLYLAFLREQLEASLEASGVAPDGHLGKLKGHAKALAKQIMQVRLLSSSCIGCTAVMCSRLTLGTVDVKIVPFIEPCQAYVEHGSVAQLKAELPSNSSLPSGAKAVIRWPELIHPDHGRPMQVCQAAASARRASAELLLEWPRLALRFGRVKAALAACKQATELTPASAELWRQRLVLEAQHAIAKALSSSCYSPRNF